MPSSKKKTARSTQIFTLFEHKNFTLLFFLSIFVLFGGMFYMLQSSAAKIKSYVTLSADACQATATGVPGNTFVWGASAENKGGSQTGVIPASGTLVGQIGGSAGMTAYGKILNSKGRVIASAQKTIPSNCF